MKKLGFGAMRLPQLGEGPKSPVDLEKVQEMVDAFLSRGFTYFDTAWMYCGGKSEEIMRRTLVDRYPRERFTLATKLPAYLLKSEADRDRVFEEQLRRTGAGYFDYYLLHDVNSGSLPVFQKYDCFAWLKAKKEAGLVRHIGFSYHDGAKLLDEILTCHPEIEFVQLQINYLDWDSLGIQSRACYETAVKHGKPVIVMEPVKGGTLAAVPDAVEQMFRACDPEMSAASWAIRFAASLENVMVVLSGMSNLDQLTDNINYMEEFVPLDATEQKMVLRAAEMINKEIAIACTGCSYCTVDCPKGIAIPQYFSLYNADLQESSTKLWSAQEGYYESLTLSSGKPADCISCGQCEKMCPQHLPIREWLTTVAKYFDEK